MKPTSEKIADRTGVSPNTVKRDAKFSEAVDAIEEVAHQLINSAKVIQNVNRGLQNAAHEVESKAENVRNCAQNRTSPPNRTTNQRPETNTEF